MDRFKFRIWYNGDYSLTPFCNLDRNGNVWLFYSENDEDMELCDGIDITDKCTVEFSTGLKDENGNLIYEGDIINCYRYSYVKRKNVDHKYVVKFGEYDQDGSDDEYGPSKCVGFYADDGEGRYNSTTSILALKEKIQIIGNVHKGEQK